MRKVAMSLAIALLCRAFVGCAGNSVPQQLVGLWIADHRLSTDTGLNTAIAEDVLSMRTWLFAIQNQQGIQFTRDRKMNAWNFGGKEFMGTFEIVQSEQSGQDILLTVRLGEQSPFEERWRVIDANTMAQQYSDDHATWWLVFSRVEETTRFVERSDQ